MSYFFSHMFMNHLKMIQNVSGLFTYPSNTKLSSSLSCVLFCATECLKRIFHTVTLQLQGVSILYLSPHHLLVNLSLFFLFYLKLVKAFFLMVSRSCTMPLVFFFANLFNMSEKRLLTADFYKFQVVIKASSYADNPVYFLSTDLEAPEGCKAHPNILCSFIIIAITRGFRYLKYQGGIYKKMLNLIFGL